MLRLLKFKSHCSRRPDNHRVQPIMFGLSRFLRGCVADGFPVTWFYEWHHHPHSITWARNLAVTIPSPLIFNYRLDGFGIHPLAVPLLLPWHFSAVRLQWPPNRYPWLPMSPTLKPPIWSLSYSQDKGPPCKTQQQCSIALRIKPKHLNWHIRSYTHFLSPASFLLFIQPPYAIFMRISQFLDWTMLPLISGSLVHAWNFACFSLLTSIWVMCPS